jgi:hypothetical protein
MSTRKCAFPCPYPQSRKWRGLSWGLLKLLITFPTVRLPRRRPTLYRLVFWQVVQTMGHSSNLIGSATEHPASIRGTGWSRPSPMTVQNGTTEVPRWLPWDLDLTGIEKETHATTNVVDLGKGRLQHAPPGPIELLNIATSRITL